MNSNTLDKSANKDKSGSKVLPLSKGGWMKSDISFNTNNEKV